jgi:hypothetical protein
MGGRPLWNLRNPVTSARHPAKIEQVVLLVEPHHGAGVAIGLHCPRAAVPRPLDDDVQKSRRQPAASAACSQIDLMRTLAASPRRHFEPAGEIASSRRRTPAADFHCDTPDAELPLQVAGGRPPSVMLSIMTLPVYRS